MDKLRAIQGEASTIVEHRKTITIDDVRAELAEMKEGAIDVEVEETGKDQGPIHQGSASPKEEQNPPSESKAQE